MKLIRLLLTAVLLVVLGGAAGLALIVPPTVTTRVESLASRVVGKARTEISGLLGRRDQSPGSSVPETPADAGSAGADSAATDQYIASVRVSTDNGAVRYLVRPTRAGRVAIGDQLEIAWQQAVARGVPDTPGLYQQFKCHPLSVVARAKRNWALEPWRPTVGLKLTLLAFCNPR